MPFSPRARRHALAPPGSNGTWSRTIGSDATAEGGTLVYVSNSYENRVYFYSYPKLKLAGTLAGFDQPEGECVNAAGDVWIADSLASQIVEYGHGSTTPKATLADTGYFPYACAVDPQTGDLAVVNEAANPVPGSLSIYRKARGTPKVYTDDSLSIPFFDAYDAKGNLYVDGIRGFYYPYFALARFRHETFTNSS